VEDEFRPARAAMLWRRSVAALLEDESVSSS
jgi:hypothetical protein